MFDGLVQQHLALCSEIVAHKHAQSLASPHLHDKLYALLKVHMSIKKIELPNLTRNLEISSTAPQVIITRNPCQSKWQSVCLAYSSGNISDFC
jgi:hypothetical protein